MDNRLLWWGAVLWVAAIGFVVYYRFHTAEIDAWVARTVEQARIARIEREAEAARAEKARQDEEQAAARRQREQEAETRRQENAERDRVASALSESRCMNVPSGVCRSWDDGTNRSGGQCLEREQRLLWCCTAGGFPRHDENQNIYSCGPMRQSTPQWRAPAPERETPPVPRYSNPQARPLPETPSATYCLNLIQRAVAKYGNRWRQEISAQEANRCEREIGEQRRRDGF